MGADAGELFYRAKGALEGLSRGAQIARLDFGRDCAAPWADPAAWLSIHAGEVTIGHLAVVAPRTKRMAGIRHAEAALFELNVDALQPHPSRQNRFEPLPKYRS